MEKFAVDFSVLRLSYNVDTEFEQIGYLLEYDKQIGRLDKHSGELLD